jgi:hypothetical protein
MDKFYQVQINKTIFDLVEEHIEKKSAPLKWTAYFRKYNE